MRNSENGNMIEAYDKKIEDGPMFLIGWEKMIRNDETGYFIEITEDEFSGFSLLMNVNEAKAVVGAINKALKEIKAEDSDD